MDIPALLAAATRQRQASASPGPFVPGQVVAVVPVDTPGAMAALAQALAGALGLAVLEVAALPSTNDGLLVFEIVDRADVTMKVRALEADPRVRFAQPNFLYQTGAQRVDPSASLFYGSRLIRKDRLDASLTGKEVRVALIDTGIDADHAELKGKVVERVDVTGRGFTADLHATLLAGIIASEPNNRIGIAGVAPAARLLSIKACQPPVPGRLEAACWSASLAKAMDFAIQKEARVINLSLGGPNKEKLLTRLVDEATARGRVVVAAAGNDGPTGAPRYPAALDNVLAVSAVDVEERLYPHATHGEYIDVVAPGVEIMSTAPGNRFTASSGTSLATAFVTGAVALLLQQQPALSPREVQELLETTAKDLGPKGKDPRFGSGLIDVCRAVAQAGGVCR